MEYHTKILIADESPATRATVRDGLLRAGYRNVEEAVNGARLFARAAGMVIKNYEGN